MVMSLSQRLRQELERSNVDRWWDTFAVGLLLAGLIVVAQRLIVTQWTEHLGLVRTLILLGGLAG